MALHISLAAEPIAHVFGFPITNSLLTTWVAMIVLVVLACVIRAKLAERPRGLQNAFEMVVEFFSTLIGSVTQNAKQTTRFFPLIFTFFIFILVSNYLGLLPGVGTIGRVEEHVAATEAVSEETMTGGDDSHAQSTSQGTGETSHEESETKLVPLFRPPNADLNSTLSWAVISVVMAQVFGMMSLGFFGYTAKFLPFKGLFSMKKGFPVPSFQGFIAFFIGFLEIISEIAKIVSFSFRLFGNVFAGEVLLVVIAFLVAYVAPLPFYALELFVGLIQALVFAMLTLVFFKMATIGHEEHEERADHQSTEHAAEVHSEDERQHSPRAAS